MKTFKLTKSIKVLLITLFLLIAVTIAVVVIFNNEAWATDPYLPWCDICSNDSELELIGSLNDDYHQYKCNGCNQTYVAPHSGAGHDGKCDICDYQYGTPHEVTVTYESQSETKHLKIVDCTVEGCSYATRTTEDCARATWGYIGSRTAETHTTYYGCAQKANGCTNVFKGSTAKHSGGTHENGGICTYADCDHPYQTHGQSTTIVGYIDITDT